MKLIYTLVEKPEDAKKIARALIAEKLAACVNIFPGVQSIYEWKGQLTESAEVALVIKVADTVFAQALARVEALHPYETPAILTFQPQDVNAKFLNFVHSRNS